MRKREVSRMTPDSWHKRLGGWGVPFDESRRTDGGADLEKRS